MIDGQVSDNLGDKGAAAIDYYRAWFLCMIVIYRFTRKHYNNNTLIVKSPGLRWLHIYTHVIDWFRRIETLMRLQTTKNVCGLLRWDIV